MAVWKQFRDKDSGRRGLRFAAISPALLLLGLPLLLLLYSCVLLATSLYETEPRANLREPRLRCSHHPLLCLRQSHRSQLLQRLDRYDLSDWSLLSLID